MRDSTTRNEEPFEADLAETRVK